MSMAGRILALLSFLVLAAHCLRMGWEVGMVVCLLLTVLVWIPQAWAQWSARIGLLIGALEWLRTLAALVSERQALGAPWHRLAAILGGVAAMAMLAAWMLTRRTNISLNEGR